MIDTRALVGPIELDTEEGVVTAPAGTSLGEILATVVPRGWFLPVTPGTKHVTLGGAIAADVHGKNHHRDGSIGAKLVRLDLLTSDGRTIEVTPGTDAFSATVGGMGLTGVVTKASLRLLPIETPSMSADTLRAPDLMSVMEALVAADQRRRYSIAWLDLTWPSRGRGVVLAADHAPLEELAPRERSRPLATPARGALPVPGAPRCGWVNQASVMAFNRIWYLRSPREETGRIRSFDAFFYPLDRLRGWNALYGAPGFLQYQFVVPPDAYAALAGVIDRLSQTRTPVALAVLKAMGPSDGGLLSFPMEGWTLALDMPLGDPELGRVLDRCDRIVADAGGRVYLAKDSRLRAEAVAEMYPGLEAWRRARAELDPAGSLRSDLADRLKLID